MEFKVPNEASTLAMVNSITNTPNSKQVSFNNPLHSSNPVQENANSNVTKEVTPEMQTAPKQAIPGLSQHITGPCTQDNATLHQ